MLTKCNLVELFSGIGSQAKALKNLNVEVHTMGTSEWDVHAIAAYDVIHNSPEIPEDIKEMGKEELLTLMKDYTFSNSGKAPLAFDSFKTYSVEALQRIYTSIRRNKNFVDVSQLEGISLPDEIDILTYSFPCQDLSNVGAFHGYNKGIDKNSGSRSSLLWQVGRILTEMNDCEKTLPRYLLMENVPTLLSKRHFDNFRMWIEDLEKLGYVSRYYQLNASSFGLPQNRPRLLMISVFVGNNATEKKIVKEYFDYKTEECVIRDYRESKYYKPHTVQDLLRLDYSNRKIWQEAIDCTPNDTVSRRKIWEDNPQIILEGGVYNDRIDAVRTITTKQDRNPNSGNLYFDSGIEGRGTFRYLTPRECLLFMGFTDYDYRKLKNNNVDFHKGDSLFSRDKVIRMAGNSIPVKLLEGVFFQIMQIDKLLTTCRKQNESHIQQNINVEHDSEIIRSYMFRKSIRSRTNHVPPLNGATVIYPKYKTAIYVLDCFELGHDCPISKTTLSGDLFWQQRTAKLYAAKRLQYEEVVQMGWKVLVLWSCEFRKKERNKTLTWIEHCIRDNDVSRGSKGAILTRGGH